MRERDEMRVVHPGRHPDDHPQDRPGRSARSPLALLTGGIAVVAILGAAAMSVPLDAPTPAPPAPAPALRPEEPALPERQEAWNEDGPQVHPATRPRVAGRVATPSEQAVACGVDDLSLTLGGWDRATGNGAATLTATNMTDHPCLVGFFPDIRIVQGRPLALTVRTTLEPGRPWQEGPPPARVLLPPDGGASAALWWRGYGAQADERSPQRMAVRFGPRDWRSVPVDGDAGPAPFDLIDGGEIELGPWRPARPDAERAP